MAFAYRSKAVNTSFNFVSLCFSERLYTYMLNGNIGVWK